MNSIDTGKTKTRQFYTSTTFQSDFALLTSAYYLWKASVDSVSNVAGISYALTFEPIPVAITSKSALNGGNSLGLTASDGPLDLCLLTITYNKTSDDDLVRNTAHRLIVQINEAAQEKGLGSPFVYLNYASPGQTPIEGYGNPNVARMSAVSRAYDPSGLFQRAVPGGFKLPQLLLSQNDSTGFNVSRQIERTDGTLNLLNSK